MKFNVFELQAALKLTYQEVLDRLLGKKPTEQVERIELPVEDKKFVLKLTKPAAYLGFGTVKIILEDATLTESGKYPLTGFTQWPEGQMNEIMDDDVYKVSLGVIRDNFVWTVFFSEMYERFITGKVSQSINTDFNIRYWITKERGGNRYTLEMAFFNRENMWEKFYSNTRMIVTPHRPLEPHTDSFKTVVERDVFLLLLKLFANNEIDISNECDLGMDEVIITSQFDYKKIVSDFIDSLNDNGVESYSVASDRIDDFVWKFGNNCHDTETDLENTLRPEVEDWWDYRQTPED